MLKKWCSNNTKYFFVYCLFCSCSLCNLGQLFVTEIMKTGQNLKENKIGKIKIGKTLNLYFLIPVTKGWPFRVYCNLSYSDSWKNKKNKCQFCENDETLKNVSFQLYATRIAQMFHFRGQLVKSPYQVNAVFHWYSV